MEREAVIIADTAYAAFLPDFDHLRDDDWPGQISPAIAPGASMFETIASNDVLLFHPYESFEPVLRLIEEAAAPLAADMRRLVRERREKLTHALCNIPSSKAEPAAATPTP